MKAAKKKREKKVTGRPRIELKEEILRALAAIGATEEEICGGLLANGVKMDLRTLKRRLQEPHYREIWDQGKAVFKQSLRRLQFRHAQMPNSAGVTMTIHMSKVHLGETEKHMLELAGRIDSAVEVNTSARERVFDKLDTISERITRRVDGIKQQAISGAVASVGSNSAVNSLPTGN